MFGSFLLSTTDSRLETRNLGYEPSLLQLWGAPSWWRVGAEFEVRQMGEAACGDTTSTFPYRAQAGVRTKTLVCHSGVYAISVLTLLKKPLARLQHCPLTQR